MPLGISNTFLFQTTGGAYDLRHVIEVLDHPTNANVVLVVFDFNPAATVPFERTAFEAAYAAALVAQATGGGGGGGVTDGDKGDVVVSGGGTVWTIDKKGVANGFPTLDGSAKVPVAQLPTGTASGVAGLDGSAKVPVAQLPAGTASGLATLDAGGKVPLAQIPAAAITDTFVVASQAAMTALTAEVGDIAVRTDTNVTYILQTLPASTVGNWVLLRSPTDLVQSVNGQQGVVVLGAADVSAVPATADGQAGRLSLKIDQRTAIADANYTALATDHLISFTSITAPRVVTLPSGTAFQAGQELVVNDESMAVSTTNTITITASGGELIDGAATEAIKAPGGMRRIFRTATGWTFDKGVLRAGNNLADLQSAASARANLSIDQRTAVADANYTAVATDRLIGYTALTAPRVVTLPSGAVFQVGQEVIVNDESLAASTTNTITIAASGGELIDGAATEVIKAPGGMRRFFRTPTGWAFDKGVLRAGNNLADVTSAASARTNLDVPSNSDALLYSLIFG